MDAAMDHKSALTRNLWVVGVVFMLAFVVLSFGGGTQRLWGYSVSTVNTSFGFSLGIGWMMLMNYQRTTKRKLIATVIAIGALGVVCIPYERAGWYYLGMLGLPLAFIILDDYRERRW
jgi:hypothetical protein